MNDLVGVSQQNYMEAVDAQRAIQEVQAAYVMAKKYSRNENQCIVKITEACKRKRMAEIAMYSYPKGGQQISGPSIRLAEVLIKYWGNASYGIKELSRDEDKSLVRAFCIDLETNTNKIIDFTVEHTIHTKKGAKKLSDPRDIYELVANQGARRLRNCILAIIPEDIVEQAVEVCEKTLLSSDNNIPIGDRIKKMVVAFSELSVTQQMLEAKIGHKIEVTTAQELVNLQKIYRSIKDGFAGVTAYFEQTKSSNQMVETAKTAPVIFSNANSEQLKEMTEMFRKLSIPEDEWTELFQEMEGKDVGPELNRIAEKFS